MTGCCDQVEVAGGKSNKHCLETLREVPLTMALYTDAAFFVLLGTRG